MSNKMVVLAAVMGLMVAGEAWAEEGKLGVTFDLTYASKWLSKGVEGYGQKGGLFKTIDIDLYGTGFGVKTTHRNSTSRGYVDKQRFDFRPYYKSQLFEDTSWATNYNLSVGYEYYPGLARRKANTRLRQNILGGSEAVVHSPDSKETIERAVRADEFHPRKSCQPVRCQIVGCLQPFG